MSRWITPFRLRWVLIISLLLSAALMATHSGLGSWLSEPMKIATGLVLFLCLLYQAELLWHKVTSTVTNQVKVHRHRVISVLTLGLFLIHAPKIGTGWTVFLYSAFIITAGISIFSKYITRPKNRSALQAQYAVHLIAGACLIGASLFHGIIAITFD